MRELYGCGEPTGGSAAGQGSRPTVLRRRELLVGLLGAPLVSAKVHSSQVRHCGIAWEVLRNGHSNRRYLHIHGDETTAREVLRDHMTRHKGTAVLVVNNERTIPAADGRLDPNRMFTRVGALANLRLLNKTWPQDKVEHELKRLDHERKPLLKVLTPPKGGLLFAVHNNARGYSVREEVEISNATSLKDASNPHEFFLVTDPADYGVLAESSFNVVLQNAPKGPDDGSMSRLMASRGIRYVNLEVGIGKRERQREMMEWAEAKLR